LKIKLNKKLFGLSVALSFCMGIAHAELVICKFKPAPENFEFFEAIGDKRSNKICSQEGCIVSWSYEKESKPDFIINLGFKNGIFSLNPDNENNVKRISGLTPDISTGEPAIRYILYDFYQTAGGSPGKPNWNLSFSRIFKTDSLLCTVSDTVSCLSYSENVEGTAEYKAYDTSPPKLVKEGKKSCALQ
jgi:hypothetical protein